MLHQIHVPSVYSIPLIIHGGLLEVLQAIPIDEIVDKGIPYVRHKLETQFPLMTVEDKGRLAKFWRYFITTWTERYDPKTWSTSSLIKEALSGKVVNEEDSALINLTNNPLERYLNNYFLTTKSYNLYTGFLVKSGTTADCMKHSGTTLACMTSLQD